MEATKYVVLYGEEGVWKAVGPFDSEEAAEAFIATDKEYGFCAMVQEMETPNVVSGQ